MERAATGGRTPRVGWREGIEYALEASQPAGKTTIAPIERSRDFLLHPNRPASRQPANGVRVEPGLQKNLPSVLPE